MLLSAVSGQPSGRAAGVPSRSSDHAARDALVDQLTYRQARAALMFLYKVTLKRPTEVEHLPVPRRPVRLPVVLSGTEVEAVLEAIRSPKYRGIMVQYAGGLRSLKPAG